MAARVQTIDGLRGIAALLVVFFHLHEAISRTASGWLWAPFDWIARNGFLGVDVFFVISGFVIALSVSKGAPTLSYFGRFILRRSIRLDPPYWSAILLEIVLLTLTLRLFTGYAVELPSVPQVLAHLAYAQALLGYGHIIDVFWTLCYEVQFYAFFVGLVVFRAMLPPRFQNPRWAVLMGATLFLVSLWTRYWRPEGLPAGLAIDRWFQFFIGVLTWRVVAKRGSMGALALSWGVLVAAVAAAGAPATQLLAVGVSALLVAAARDPRWGRPLASRPVLFLGAISYSLYLYHASVGWRFVSLVQRIFPGPWTPPEAIAVYLLGIVVSVGFSASLWWFIERPCLTLSQRIRLPLRRDQPAPRVEEVPAAVPAIP